MLSQLSHPRNIHSDVTRSEMCFTTMVPIQLPNIADPKSRSKPSPTQRTQMLKYPHPHFIKNRNFHTEPPQTLNFNTQAPTSTTSTHHPLSLSPPIHNNSNGPPNNPPSSLHHLLHHLSPLFSYNHHNHHKRHKHTHHTTIPPPSHRSPSLQQPPKSTRSIFPNKILVDSPSPPLHILSADYHRDRDVRCICGVGE